MGTLQKTKKKENKYQLSQQLNLSIIYYIIEANISLAQRNEWRNERRKKIIILWVSSELNNKSTMHIQQSYDEILSENRRQVQHRITDCLLWDIGQLNHLCGESEKSWMRQAIELPFSLSVRLVVCYRCRQKADYYVSLRTSYSFFVRLGVFFEWMIHELWMDMGLYL